jgi:hypothetical protein
MSEPSSNVPGLPPPSPEEARLESWKEIAVYLRREVRTVQRWEKQEGLPVHRHTHSERASVYAYRSELETWWNNRRPRLEADEATEEKPARYRPLLVALGMATLALALTWTFWLLNRMHTGQAAEAAVDPEATLPERIFVAAPLAGAAPVPSPANLWVPLSAEGESPVPRSGAKAVFDPAGGNLLVFGGFSTDFLNDTWLLKGATGEGKPKWLRVAPRGGPPPGRMSHSMVYDPAHARMIVFGGRDATQYFNDVWVLAVSREVSSSPRWVKLRPLGAPPPTRAGHAAAYDPKNDAMVIYGGISSSPGQFFSDVWVLEHAGGVGGTPQWTELSPRGTGPGPRRDHAAAYDPASNRLLVIGGFTTPPQSPPVASDVWILENATGRNGAPAWSLLRTDGAPPPARAEHVAAFDATSNVLTLAFGSNGGANLEDVWTLSHANGFGGTPQWKSVNLPDPRPGSRSLPAVAHNPKSGQLILYGGRVGGGAASLGDVWVLTPVSDVAEEFEDDFAAAELHPAWQVLPGVGRFSLAENPGQLRYRSLPPGPPNSRLLLFRQFRGEDWSLEVKISRFSGTSGGSRYIHFRVGFGSLPRHGDGSTQNDVSIGHWRDDWTGQDPGDYSVRFSEHGEAPEESLLPAGSPDSKVWRIRRVGRNVSVACSDDGSNFRTVAEHTFGPQVDAASQFVIISGSSFANFDSYTDFDYIRLRKGPIP